MASEERVWHDPSDWIALNRVLRRLRVTSDDAFLDYGAGLGRAMLVAARFPFRRIVGVELSEELAAGARQNLSRFRGRKAEDFLVVTADAVDYDVPDDISVVYLYSPFLGETFQRVIERLVASVDRRPRILRLVYNYPAEHNRLIATGRIEVLDVASRSWPTRRGVPDDVIVTYLLLPSGGRAALPAPAPAPGPGLDAFPQWRGPYDPGYTITSPARA